MADEKLILTPFKKALDSLQNALAQPKTEFTRDAEKLLHELEKTHGDTTHER